MRVLTIWICLVCAMCGLNAQTNKMEVRRLSLEECFEIALQHNFDVKISKLYPVINQYTLRGAYAPYDPTLTVTGGHDYEKSPAGVDSQGRVYPANVINDNRMNSGLAGLTPWGLNYNVGANFRDTYGTLPENATGDLGFFNLTQPLLRNFWIDSTRLQIFLDRTALKSSEIGVRYQIMKSLTAVEEAYYNLIYAQENIKVQRKALELAEQLVAENKKRVEVGAMAPLDEKQAESQAASSRADLLAAEGSEDTQQRVLKSLLSDQYHMWHSVHIEPTISLIAVPQTFDLQDSWKNGLAQRPDLLQQKLTVEQQVQIVKYQKNQMYPEVDIVGGYGWNASALNFQSALDQYKSLDNPYWSIGGQFIMPLARTGSRNAYKGAKATQEQINLQTRQLEQNILIQIENAISVAVTSLQRVSATREARIFADAALQAEQKKLENGKSTNFEVLQLQKNLTSARSDEIRALADYNNALAELALNDGSTLERDKITIVSPASVAPTTVIKQQP